MKTKILRTTIKKCKSCGADLRFDPKSQNLICDNCNSITAFEKKECKNKHNLDEKSSLYKYSYKISNKNIDRALKCKTCGAEIPLNNLEYAAFCEYCNHHSLAEINDFSGLRPDVVYPFLIDKTQAIEILRTHIKNKFFLPSNFKKNLPKKKITGVYLPSFSFDSEANTNYVLHIIDDDSPRPGTYHIPGQSHIRCIAGSINTKHTDVAIEASSKINGKQLASVLPFMQDKAHKFSEDFLRGFVVEHYDNTLEFAYNLAKQDMQSEIKNQIRNKHSGDSFTFASVKSVFKNTKYNYSLVPVYLFEFTYNKKHHTTIMNGQTGKVGKGLPISKLKISFVVVLMLLLLGGFIGLFFI